MKYLHIMPPSQRMMLTYVEMLRENFPAEDHKILLASPLTQNDGGLLLYKNVQSFESLGKWKVQRFRNIGKELMAADRVVFHNFMPTTSWTGNLLLHKSILDKSIWVIWGIDMYNYKRPGKGFITGLKNKMNYYMRSRMRYPVAVSECDIKVYNDLFGQHKILFAPYAFSDNRFAVMDEAAKRVQEGERRFIDIRQMADYNPKTGEIESSGNLEEDTGECLNVQVCHNGFPFNQHFEILNLLKTICNGENKGKVRLYLPLNYGDGQLTDTVTYVDALTSYVNQMFDSNVVVLRNMLPNNLYTQYLSQIDIGIFNAPRHNALGNIVQLLYMGKKVYLSEKSPLLPYLREKGLTIHPVSELKGIDLEELSRKDDNNGNKAWIRKAFGVEIMKELWQIIFEYAEDKISYETAFEKYSKAVAGIEEETRG